MINVGDFRMIIDSCVHEVVIACAADEIARHPRYYEREDFVFNPLHYLAPLERKIGALDRPRRWSAENCPKSSRRCAACSRRAWASPAAAGP